MKKRITAKGIRWLVATATALLVLAMAVPLTMSLMDTSSILDAGLGDTNPRTDVDNLFLYVMNRSLPVGSIYTTTDPTLNTPEAMGIKYGGKWTRWARGRVPVGVNVDGVLDVIEEDQPEELGGAMPALKGSSVAMDLSVAGSVTLDGGDPIVYLDDLTLSATDVTLSGFKDFYSNSHILTEDNLPSHTHSSSFRLYYKKQYDGDASTSTSTTYNDGSGYQLKNPTNWSATIGSRGSADPTAVQVTTRLNTSGTNNVVSVLGTPTWPTVTDYTVNPVHLPQEVTQEAIEDLGAIGVNSVLSYTDDTVQPYVTVYMYRREELAKLAQW